MEALKCKPTQVSVWRAHLLTPFWCTSGRSIAQTVDSDAASLVIASEGEAARRLANELFVCVSRARCEDYHFN